MAIFRTHDLWPGSSFPPIAIIFDPFEVQPYIGIGVPQIYRDAADGSGNAGLQPGDGSPVESAGQREMGGPSLP